MMNSRDMHSNDRDGARSRQSSLEPRYIDGIPTRHTRRQKLEILIPIGLLIAFQQGFSQFGVILDNLQTIFPEASPTTIQMIVGMSSLTAIPVSLLSGLLATFLSRKKIAIGALCIMLIGGLLPVVLHSDISFLFISSGMIGISQGLIISTSTGMCAENFIGGERNFAMGLKQVTDCIGNVIIAVLAGQLCLIAWYYAYVVYLLVIPIILLVAKFLPEREPDKKLWTKEKGFEGLRFVKRPAFLYMVFFMILCGFSNFGLYYNGAMLAAEKGFGDAAFISIIFSMSNIISLVFGLLYAPIAKALSKYALAVSMLVISASYFMFFLSENAPFFIAAGVVWGIGCSLVQSSSLVFLANSLPSGSYGLGLAIGNAMINVGISLSPIISNGLSGMLFGVQTANNSILIFAIGCLLACLIETMRESLSKRRMANIEDL